MPKFAAFSSGFAGDLTSGGSSPTILTGVGWGNWYFFRCCGRASRSTFAIAADTNVSVTINGVTTNIITTGPTTFAAAASLLETAIQSNSDGLMVVPIFHLLSLVVERLPELLLEYLVSVDATAAIANGGFYVANADGSNFSLSISIGQSSGTDFDGNTDVLILNGAIGNQVVRI